MGGVLGWAKQGAGGCWGQEGCHALAQSGDNARLLTEGEKSSVSIFALGRSGRLLAPRPQTTHPPGAFHPQNAELTTTSIKGSCPHPPPPPPLLCFHVS